jgi:hypothetical protein
VVSWEIDERISYITPSVESPGEVAWKISPFLANEFRYISVFLFPRAYSESASSIMTQTPPFAYKVI